MCECLASYNDELSWLLFAIVSSMNWRRVNNNERERENERRCRYIYRYVCESINLNSELNPMRTSMTQWVALNWHAAGNKTQYNTKCFRQITGGFDSSQTFIATSLWVTIDIHWVDRRWLRHMSQVNIFMQMERETFNLKIGTKCIALRCWSIILLSI